MKAFLVVATFLLMSSWAFAQVYTFKPKYAVQILCGHDMKSSPSFEKVAERLTATYVIDLDKKTISIPRDAGSDPMVKPIEDIVSNRSDNSFILKMKSDKDVGQVWSFYKFALDREGNPRYLLLTERLTGKRFARDTFFNLYTNDLTKLFFALQCTSEKRYIVSKGDKASRDARHKEFLAAAFNDEENTVEMRDGYMYWKEGSGKHAIRHKAGITSVEKLNVAGGEGVKILCKEPGKGACEIYYGYASVAHHHFITIYRDKDDATTEVILMK